MSNIDWSTVGIAISLFLIGIGLKLIAMDEYLDDEYTEIDGYKLGQVLKEE